MRSHLSTTVALALVFGLGSAACGDDAKEPQQFDTFASTGDTGGPPPAPDVTAPASDVHTPVPDISTPPAVVRDPCADLGLFGRCVGNTAETCVLGTGGAATSVSRLPCGWGYECTESFWGPECVDTRECADGATRCVDGDAIQECVNGRWGEPWGCEFYSCRTLLGAGQCAGYHPWYYSAFSGRVTLEARGVNADWTDWSGDIYMQPAAGLAIASVSGDEVVDVTTVAEDGSFSLEIVADPETGEPDSRLVVVAMSFEHDRFDEDPKTRFLTADPGSARGVLATETPSEEQSDDPSTWAWVIDAASLGDGGEFRIREAEGSGVLFAHMWMAAVERILGKLWGVQPQSSVIAWIGYGTDWDCGACFSNRPMRDYANQLFIGGGPDAPYWSTAVLFHEMGHWAMRAYGFPPGEGGTHILGIPQHPGLAWSEGFATGLSAVLRGERTYYDKQNGGFFWVDLDTRRYSSESPWYLPSPELGLLQLIDENEVARMVIELADATGDHFFEAIAAGRMTEPPFARGYRRRSWGELDDDGWPWPYQESDWSVPMFADYLDALRCEYGTSPATIDAVTQPATRYPYPSQAPLCDTMSSPISVHFYEVGSGLVAHIDRFIPLEEDLVFAFEPGGTAMIIPAGTPPGRDDVVWTDPSVGSLGGPSLSPSARPTGLRIATGGQGWGLSGVVPVSPPQVLGPKHSTTPVVIGRNTVYPVEVAPIGPRDPTYNGERAEIRWP